MKKILATAFVTFLTVTANAKPVEILDLKEKEMIKNSIALAFAEANEGNNFICQDFKKNELFWSDATSHSTFAAKASSIFVDEEGQAVLIFQREFKDTTRSDLYTMYVTTDASVKKIMSLRMEAKRWGKETHENLGTIIKPQIRIHPPTWEKTGPDTICTRRSY